MTRRTERLGWIETDEMKRAMDDRKSEAAWVAPGTFALLLALRGWPIITDDGAWDKQLRQGFSDFGGPEGLAYKIQIWEALNARHEWRSTAPRVPGLELPTWAELEARWERDDAK